MNFSEVLKKLRTEAGLNQAQLAENIGLSLSAISMYERGEREPDFEKLKAMADFFNVSFEHLLGYKVDVPSKRVLRSNYNKEVKRIPIIRITTEIGTGSEKNPYRLGFEYWDMGGNLLFVTEATEDDIKVYKAPQGLSQM